MCKFRKFALIISGCILTVAGILLAFSRMAGLVTMLILGRFLIGIAAAIVYTAQPMYLLESAPTHLRGSAGVFTLIGITGGVVIGQTFSLHQVLGNKEHWQLALPFYLIFVLIGFLPSFWFPESARWIMKVKHDEEAARNSLKRLRGKDADSAIDAEMAEIKIAVASTSEILGFLEVIKNHEYCLPLVIVISFMSCQQLSGINGLWYYSVRIFTKCGFSAETAMWLNSATGMLNFTCAVISLFLMRKFNRRPCMMVSSLGSAISLCALAFALKFVDSVSWFPTLCMVLMDCYIIFFNIGLAPIPIFIGTELFQLPPRSAAMSAGTFSVWCGNFLIGMTFPPIESAVGPFVFLPCSCVCIYIFLLTWRYLPETRGTEPFMVRPLVANGRKSKVI